MIYLTEQQITDINAFLIHKTSPSEPIKVLDAGALNMIVNLPKQYVFGEELYPTLDDKTAILFIQLVLKHIFAHANKPTAFFTMTMFLNFNGYGIQYDDDFAEELTVSIATEGYTDAKFTEVKDWINEDKYRK
jgi:death-on-curing protein